MSNKFLLRKSTGDQPIATEADLVGSLQRGQCKASDFVFDFGTNAWSRVGDHPALTALFAEKPAGVPERRVIYYLQPGGTVSLPQGPLSTKEIQARAQQRELCAGTWVFVEGDKEWRQVRNVKILNDMLPPLPAEAPAKPAAPEAPPPAPPTGPPKGETNPSISIDLGMGGLDSPPSAPPTAAPAAASLADDPYVEKEESTLALDIHGLNLHSENVTATAAEPLAKPAKPGIAPMPAAAAPPKAPSAVPPSAPPKAPSAAPPSAPPKAPPAAPAGAPSLSIETPPGGVKRPPAGNNDFDGIVAEIPMDPIWLVKQGNSETVNGPFRFLEIVKFLEEGKLTKNDKISKTGTKSFVKIQQQYEFNVKFSVESVVENGQEKQKILIRRRHPRVPYMTGVQIVSKYGLLAGNCVNISAGGILMEVPKAEFNLGEIIEVKILPGLIAKSISCKSLIIGKIPKAPPGYALKFEDLKPDDKEAIEYYVQETLKREMSKKN